MLHYVLEVSIDARKARTLVRKQEVIDRALDVGAKLPEAEKAKLEVELREPVMPGTGDAVTVTVAEIAVDAPKMTGKQIETIHTGIKMLAGVCDGAAKLDGCGYSKVDAGIGHSLAQAGRLSQRQGVLGQRLVNKYRRQLPVALVQEALGL
jgi:hypothetical protein